MTYRNLLPLLLLLAILFTAAVAAADADTDADKAVCPVCRVHDGETELEKVLATAEYRGQTYGFCSEKCRDTFLEAPQGYLPPVFPRPAPAFAVRDLDGGEVASSELPAGALLLDFWATWCPPCIKDLPRLSKLHRRFAGSGFAVVSVSIDDGDDAASAVTRVARKRKTTHPIYLDSAETPAWGAFQVRVVPTQFLLDADGNIVAQWSGKIDFEIVEAAVEDLLTDEPRPAASTSRR
ncbi:MAG: redoxin domain-containing protein [Thermoanaerobaculia bacterium]